MAKKYTEETCGACNGSGEGSYDGSTCPNCGGKGSELVEKEEDDGPSSGLKTALL